MVGTTFYQVVARYVFNKPPTWSEETTLLVMIWVSLLTAGIGVRRGIHMKVELFLSTLPLLMRKVCEIAVLLVVGYYGYVMAKYSYILAIRLPNKLPATGISVVWMYMPASICGVLIIFSVAVKVLEYFLLSEKTRGARK
ncbi:MULTISPECIES: TRAP transporter small permease [unclassified Thermotoga]|uniref:TRAP transporter small permease n=1 Tax=unclassified Thermotoga TaxID=2631113 RepID=UPI001F1A31B7|nr:MULTISPECIES: TRAP transporter small permease [unclassified Thermotoga]